MLAKPLPYGRVRKYLEQTGLGGEQGTVWLVRQARACQRSGLRGDPIAKIILLQIYMMDYLILTLTVSYCQTTRWLKL